MSAATHVVSRAGVNARQLGWLGIGLGALAWFVALPPLLVRTPVPSLLLGAMAVGAGVVAVRDDEKRLGYGAMAAGVVGAIGGVVATRSGVGNLEDVFVWSALVAAMLRF